MVRLCVEVFDKLHGLGLRDMVDMFLRLRGGRWNNYNINNDKSNRVGVDVGIGAGTTARDTISSRSSLEAAPTRKMTASPAVVTRVAASWSY